MPYLWAMGWYFTSVYTWEATRFCAAVQQGIVNDIAACRRRHG